MVFENKPGGVGCPDDSYLSPSTLREAADVLAGLATALGHVEGVWAEDAEQDAQHIRLLADALARWSPRPRHDDVAGPVPDPAWEITLGLYLRQGLRSGS